MSRRGVMTTAVHSFRTKPCLPFFYLPALPLSSIGPTPTSPYSPPPPSPSQRGRLLTVHATSPFPQTRPPFRSPPPTHLSVLGDVLHQRQPVHGVIGKRVPRGGGGAHRWGKVRGWMEGRRRGCERGKTGVGRVQKERGGRGEGKDVK